MRIVIASDKLSTLVAGVPKCDAVQFDNAEDRAASIWESAVTDMAAPAKEANGGTVKWAYTLSYEFINNWFRAR